MRTTIDRLPPAPLPSRRKRALSIGSVETPTGLRKLLLGSSSQYTHPQSECLLLNKLPAEIRNEVYRHILGDRILHIIPSLVPSHNQPPTSRFGRAERPLVSRLDYEPCKKPGHHDSETGFGGIGQKQFSGCAIWINKEGELAFNVPESVIRAVPGLDTGFLTWWSRKNRSIALLKTCRQIYSEAIHVLYTTNTFDFRSLRIFTQFPTTVLPQRLHSIRHVNLHFTIKDGDESNWQNTCLILQSMKGLQNLHIRLEDKRKFPKFVYMGHNVNLLGGLKQVNVGGLFVVSVDWATEIWEKADHEFPFEIVGEMRPSCRAQLKKVSSNAG